MTHGSLLLRVAWIAAGLGFTLWLVADFQLDGELPAGTLESNASVTVTRTADGIEFRPSKAGAKALVFLPGGMVDPLAYAPLLRGVRSAVSLPSWCFCRGVASARMAR